MLQKYNRSTNHRCHGMPRRKGISRRFRNRILHGVEARMGPWTGTLAKKLQSLIYNRADKTCDEDVVALILIDAPEEDYRNGEEYRFLSKVSDKREEEIENGISYFFKKI